MPTCSSPCLLSSSHLIKLAHSLFYFQMLFLFCCPYFSSSKSKQGFFFSIQDLLNWFSYFSSFNRPLEHPPEYLNMLCTTIDVLTEVTHAYFDLVTLLLSKCFEVWVSWKSGTVFSIFFSHFFGTLHICAVNTVSVWSSEPQIPFFWSPCESAQCCPSREPVTGGHSFLAYHARRSSSEAVPSSQTSFWGSPVRNKSQPLIISPVFLPALDLASPSSQLLLVVVGVLHPQGFALIFEDIHWSYLLTGGELQN